MRGSRLVKGNKHGCGARWLPSDRSHVRSWLGDLVDDVARNPQPLHPVVARFQAFIEEDARAFMLFNAMFEQLPASPDDADDPSGEPQVRNWRTMIQLLNAVINRAPEFNRSGVVGVPINAVLDHPMGTPAGFAAFLDPGINAHLRAVLNEWARFLRSADSRIVLSDDEEHGWFGAHARAEMPDFDTEFECDPAAPHHGFDSWDAFFTRRFRSGVRPVADPDDGRVIANACESAPYRVATGVKERDRFWIKGQDYSLAHMLAGDELVPRFVGGTVYQAYLSALSYHRWHSPVSGRVVKAYAVPGTYYSETFAEKDDDEAPVESQAYTTAVATRALIFIEADEPALGLVCFMGIGMAEVSTCDIGVYEGQRVAKGDEIGMFHYGGSTWCLLLGPDVRVTFDLHGQEPGLQAHNILVRAVIARLAR